MTNFQTLLSHRPLPWTASDYLSTRQTEGGRAELIDGSPHLPGSADRRHQAVTMRLWCALDRMLSKPFEPVLRPKLRLNDHRVVIPDVVVVADSAIDSDYSETLVLDADDVALAAEVVDPSTQARDQILRPALFAEARIEWYLRVECAPELRVELLRREGDGFVDHARASPGECVELPGLGCSIEVEVLGRGGDG